jgi:hypothetical protein
MKRSGLTIRRKTVLAIAWALLLAPVVVLLTACSTTPPTPLQPGAETTPPYGCIEYRKRGGRC